MNKGARHARILSPPRPYSISVRGTRACAYLPFCRTSHQARVGRITTHRILHIHMTYTYKILQMCTYTYLQNPVFVYAKSCV